jgi:hypothetical protein
MTGNVLGLIHTEVPSKLRGLGNHSGPGTGGRPEELLV